MRVPQYSVPSTQYSVRCLLLLTTWLALSTAASQPAHAKEPYAEFLRALQDRGYGEQALAYLDQIADEPDLPEELKRDLDLERAKSLRLAANEASDPQQRQSRLAEAKRLTDKFIADNPEHPAAAAVLLDEADDTLRRGQNALALYQVTRDEPAKEKAAEEARKLLATAAEQFDATNKRLKERLDALPKDADAAKSSSSARSDLEFTWLRGRLTRAHCDYLAAQTYDEPKDDDRLDLLKKAAGGFDAIYQAYRGQRVASIAHLWHGKVIEELGDLKLAMDFWDEVLVAAPEGPDADPDLAPLFGQAQLFYLRGMATNEEPKEVMQEGDQWLQSHKRWQNTPQYQGIALEVAKARLAYSEKLREGSEKKKTLRDAINALEAIGKSDSEYRQQALTLRRESISKLGADGALTFEEVLASADETANERNWTAADALYRQAAEMAAKANDKGKQETIKQRLVQMIYKQALAQYGAGDMEKVLNLCSEIVGKHPTNPVAEEASSLAVAAALRAFTEAKSDGKDAALGRLQKVAEHIVNQWPMKSVSDDARMALAQAFLLKSDLPKALEQLSGVNEQSKSYATALQILGQIRWKQYADAKKADGAEERGEELQKMRAEAVTHLQASVDRQKVAWQAGSDPMPASLFDTQLLLAEIRLEAGETKEAAELFAALLQPLKTQAPSTLDIKALRAFYGAVRAAILQGQPAQAAETTLALAAITTDEAQPNAVLVDLARLLSAEVIKAQSAKLGGEATNEAGGFGNPLAAQLGESQGKLLDLLAARKEFAVPQLIYVGTACASAQKNDKAREIFERLLAKIDSDDKAKAAAGDTVPQIRARLVGLLRNEGRLDEAQKQVDLLLANHPNALGPLMEKGYILQNLAERDPRRWDDCIQHWTSLRLRLRNSKPLPQEYYDVLYNAALGLVRQARQTNNKEKALQAEQMLRNTLILTPRLNGPEMVAKYNALLTVAASFRTTGTPMSATAR